MRHALFLLKHGTFTAALQYLGHSELVLSELLFFPPPRSLLPHPNTDMSGIVERRNSRTQGQNGLIVSPPTPSATAKKGASLASLGVTLPRESESALDEKTVHLALETPVNVKPPHAALQELHALMTKRQQLEFQLHQRMTFSKDELTANVLRLNAVLEKLKSRMYAPEVVGGVRNAVFSRLSKADTTTMLQGDKALSVSVCAFM